MREQLMLWSEEAPARTSPSRESAQDSQASAVGSGSINSASPSSAKRRSSSGKTSVARFPATLDMISESSSVRWPTQGMMRAGECSALPTLERHTDGSGCSWWPTPDAHMSKETNAPTTEYTRRRTSMTALCTMWATPGAGVHKESPYQNQMTVTKQIVPMTREKNRPLLSADWVEVLMGWPPGWTRLPAGLRVKAKRNTNGSRHASRAKQNTGSDG